MIMLVPNYTRNYAVVITCDNCGGIYRSIHKGVILADNIHDALTYAKEDIQELHLRGNITINISCYDTEGCHPCRYSSHYFINKNYEEEKL